MKERGMIFNEYQVRAILDGRKTQTRRIMKVQPSDGFHPTHNGYDLDLNAHWYTPGVVDKNGYLQPAKKDVFGVADENEATPARSVQSAIASGCERRGHN